MTSHWQDDAMGQRTNRLLGPGEKIKRSHAEAFSSNNATPVPSPRAEKRKSNQPATYKVQVQRVHIRKKKETYDDSQSVVPPDGYYYLPLGYRKLKEQCRDVCLHSSTKYYVVSIFPQNNGSQIDRKTITRNIYRFGWHFPTDIILKAMASLGLTTEDQIWSIRNPLAETANMTSEHFTNENLQELILDLFPRIPASDMKTIMEHAFERGSKRVGNAGDVPFPRRVQLAVMAHIRHIHTNYDALLKSTKRNIARLQIEPKCLRVLLKWRGEDDEVEIEEREEEVIEIDSDEDSDDELDPYNYNSHNSHHSRRSQDLEIASWKHNGRSLQIYKEDLPQEYYRPSFIQLVRRGSHYTQPVRLTADSHPIPLGNVNSAYGLGFHSNHLPPPPSQGSHITGHYSNPIVISDSPQRLPPGYSRGLATDSFHPPLYSHQSTAPRPLPDMTEYSNPQATPIVYDKLGRPHYLLEGRAIPVSEAQDTPLPSIEIGRNSRPSPEALTHLQRVLSPQRPPLPNKAPPPMPQERLDTNNPPAWIPQPPPFHSMGYAVPPSGSLPAPPPIQRNKYWEQWHDGHRQHPPPMPLDKDKKHPQWEGNNSRL